MVSGNPAMLVGHRVGSVVKSSGSARGSTSRLGPPRAVSGRRHSRGIPRSAITSATPVRFSPSPSAASAVAISSIEWPSARSSRIRLLAASLAGARLGPGVAVTKNSWEPARKSRTAEFSDAGVYPNRSATAPAGSPSCR